MKLFPKRFGLRPVLVSLLVLFAAGFLFAPASVLAATDVSVASVTNINFVSEEDMNIFLDSQVASVNSIDRSCDNLTNYIHTVWADLVEARIYCNIAISNLVKQIDDGNATPETRVALTRLQQSLGDIESSLGLVSASSSTVLAQKNTLSVVRSSLTDPSVPTYRIVVYESSGSGGGCTCSCPDYTDLLTSIANNTAFIKGVIANEIIAVQQIGDYLEDLWYVLPNAIAGFESGLLGTDPDWSDFSSIGYNGFAFLGSFVSNQIDVAESFMEYADTGWGLLDSGYVTTGPSFTRQMWNFLLKPYGMLLADDDRIQYNGRNSVIPGFRDFFDGPAYYVYPTNSYSKPLWVNMMTNGIGGSSQHPIFVEVTTGPNHERVSIDNPVWVQFTNSITLSSSDVIQVALTNDAVLEINFDELIDAINDLTNSTWRVFVVNSNDLANALLDEEEQRINQMEDDLDDEAPPDEETQTLPTTSFHFVDTVTRSYKEVLTSYKSMFDAIPSEPPSDITVWHGGNYGDLQIESIHWDPSDHATVLRHCRNLFSFGWYLVYVFVVFVTAAIDLCVCGVLVYMVYGLFLGKPEVAYHGMLWCFKTLSTFFGYKPQSMK